MRHSYTLIPWDSFGETTQIHTIGVRVYVSVHQSTYMHHYLVAVTLTRDRCRHTMRNKLGFPLGFTKWLTLSLHLEIHRVCVAAFHSNTSKNKTHIKTTTTKTTTKSTLKETEIEETRGRTDASSAQDTSIQITVKRTRLTLMYQAGTEREKRQKKFKRERRWWEEEKHKAGRHKVMTNKTRQHHFCISFSSVAQSGGVKPVSWVKLLFSILSCEIRNLSISLWGKHGCSHCIILYKHSAILFELCCSTHYTSLKSECWSIGTFWFCSY